MSDVNSERVVPCVGNIGLLVEQETWEQTQRAADLLRESTLVDWSECVDDARLH